MSNRCHEMMVRYQDGKEARWGVRGGYHKPDGKVMLLVQNGAVWETWLVCPQRRLAHYEGILRNAAEERAIPLLDQPGAEWRWRGERRTMLDNNDVAALCAEPFTHDFFAVLKRR